MSGNRKLTFKTHVRRCTEPCSICGGCNDSWYVAIYEGGGLKKEVTGGGCYGPPLDEKMYLTMLAEYLSLSIQLVWIEDGEETAESYISPTKDVSVFDSVLLSKHGDVI